MPHAIRFHKTGGPEVLQWDEVSVGKPGQGEARIRHTAVGLNYVETYFRSGLYPAPLPSGLGTEAAGVVEEVGPGVTDVKAGDHVAYVGGPLGAYSETRVMPTERLVVLPKGISDQQGAAMMLKGLTTQYLIRQIFKVKKGDTILFHAAAGGVGLIACQWAKSLGATVIGTVGSEEKAKLAKDHGCDYPIRLRPRGFRRARQGDHQGRDGAGGVRLRRQGHLHEVARHLAAARPDGEFRAVVGIGRPDRSRHLRGRRARSSTRGRRSTPTPPSAPIIRR